MQTLPTESSPCVPPGSHRPTGVAPFRRSIYGLWDALLVTSSLDCINSQVFGKQSQPSLRTPASLSLKVAERWDEGKTWIDLPVLLRPPDPIHQPFDSDQTGPHSHAPVLKEG